MLGTVECTKVYIEFVIFFHKKLLLRNTFYGKKYYKLGSTTHW